MDHVPLSRHRIRLSKGRSLGERAMYVADVLMRTTLKTVDRSSMILYW